MEQKRRAAHSRNPISQEAPLRALNEIELESAPRGILHHTCAQSYFASFTEISGFLAKLLYAVAYVPPLTHTRVRGGSSSLSLLYKGGDQPARLTTERYVKDHAPQDVSLGTSLLYQKSARAERRKFWRMLIAAKRQGRIESIRSPQTSLYHQELWCAAKDEMVRSKATNGAQQNKLWCAPKVKTVCSRSIVTPLRTRVAKFGLELPYLSKLCEIFLFVRHNARNGNAILSQSCHKNV